MTPDVLMFSSGFALNSDDLYNPQLTEQTSSGTPFMIVLCLANFFQNFGPNTTTFVLPGEAFPTRYRSTAYGISAASGKLGAVIAQIIYAVAVQKTWPFSTMYVSRVLSVFCLTHVYVAGRCFRLL